MACLFVGVLIVAAWDGKFGRVVVLTGTRLLLVRMRYLRPWTWAPVDRIDEQAPRSFSVRYGLLNARVTSFSRPVWVHRRFFDMVEAVERAAPPRSSTGTLT